MEFKLMGETDTRERPAIITDWGLIHLLAGALIYLYTKYIYKNISITNAFIIFIIIHTIYELKDLKYYLTNDCGYWNNNSVINSIGDTIFAMVGFFLATQFKNVTIIYIAGLTVMYLVIMSLYSTNKLG